MIEIKTKGIPEAINKLNGISGNIENAAQGAMRDGANQIISDARADVHVVSGKLRNSLGITGQSKNEVRGGSMLDYAGREEYRQGGRKGSHEYLRPAIDKNIELVYRRIVDAIGSALR